MRSILIALLIILIITPFSSAIDQKVASSIYHYFKESFDKSTLDEFFYRYADVPAKVTGITALIVLLLSFVWPRLKSARPGALMLVLMILIGPLLITNFLFKQHWGRPRPIQTTEYGGKQAFRPYYSPDFHSPTQSDQRSFPSGHASAGFYFFALYFVGKRYQKRWLAITGMTLAWVLGIAFGFFRLAQGAHYLSDVVFAALLMWILAVILDRLIFGPPDQVIA